MAVVVGADAVVGDAADAVVGVAAGAAVVGVVVLELLPHAVTASPAATSMAATALLLLRRDKVSPSVSGHFPGIPQVGIRRPSVRSLPNLRLQI